MSDGFVNGDRARLDRLERDQADLAKRMAGVELAVERTVTALPYIQADIREIKEWTKEQQANEAEDRRLSAGQKLVAAGIIVAGLGSIVTAIVTLAAAGVFG